MTSHWPLLCILMVCLCIGCKRSDSGANPAGTVEQQEAATISAGDRANMASRPQPESAQEAIQMMKEQLRASTVASKKTEPALEDVESMIAFGKQALDRFPEDSELTQSVAAMMFQSLTLLGEQPQKQTERRLEVGQIARVLVERSDLPAEVRATLSFLFLEEAKGLIQKQDIAAGWDSIQKSREMGWKQSKLIYLDPTFAPILADETYQAEVRSWLIDEVDQALEQQEKFPVTFSIPSLDEEAVELTLEDFADKQLILLDFWGTWCGPCRQAIPHLNELHDKHAENLAIVGVTFEQPFLTVSLEDTKARVDRMRESLPINYQCAYGNFDLRSTVPGFQGFPCMLLLDNQGRARLLLSGYHPGPVLEVIIDRALAQASPATE